MKWTFLDKILVGKNNPNRPNMFHWTCKMYYTIYLVKWSNFMDFNSSRSLWGHSTTTWTKFYPILTPSPLKWTIVDILHDTYPLFKWPSMDSLLTPLPPSFYPRSYWMAPVCCRRNWKPRHTHVIIVFFLHLQSECRRRPPRHAPLCQVLPNFVQKCVKLSYSVKWKKSWISGFFTVLQFGPWERIFFLRFFEASQNETSLYSILFWSDKSLGTFKFHEYKLKEYFPNLLERVLLPQFFVFWLRDFKFWLLAYFLFSFNCAKF